MRASADRSSARPRRRLLAVLSAVASTAALVSVAPTAATADPTNSGSTNYPTWAQVEAAAQSASGKQAEIDKLTSLLGQLQATSALLDQQAEQRNEDYLQAEADLQRASVKVDAMRDRADAAGDKASASKKRAEQLIAQLAKVGGGDMTAALIGSTAQNVDGILYRVTTMNKISQTTAQILQTASYDRKTAEALGHQAEAAEKVLAARSDDAKQALAAAQSAADAATTQLAATQQQADTLASQLASLDAEGSALAQQYLTAASDQADQGQLVAQVTATASSVTALASSAGTGPGSPNAAAVKTAIDFALAQVGKPYEIAAAGPDSWDCSGLTMAAYAAAGIPIGGHGATLQYDYLQSTGRLVPLSQLQVGDLVFYNATGDATAAKDHVAIYAGSGLIIEAPRTGVPVRVWPMYTQGIIAFAGRPSA